MSRNHRATMPRQLYRRGAAWGIDCTAWFSGSELIPGRRRRPIALEGGRP